ncbi:hypothetical protein C0995_006285 [Termitomyces sp. Mi166|nr:hypothetical protein C0995_006285 [Termitomyces sp. Mi166\
MSGSHLSVVLDLSPTQWHLSAQHALPLNAFLAQLLAFLNAHIASKHENTLAVFGAFPGNSLCLYSSTDPAPQTQVIDPNSYPPFKLVDSTIVTRITNELDHLGEPGEEGIHAVITNCLILSFSQPRVLSSVPSQKPYAVTRPFSVHPNQLTHLSTDVNRITLPSSSTPNKHTDALDPAILPDPRILVLSVSPDLSTSYIPIMNAIFSAQKLASIFHQTRGTT